MKAILHILVLLLILFFPTLFTLFFYKIQKQLSLKKTLYIIIASLIQIIISLGVVLLLDLELGLVIVLFVGLSLLKAYFFAIFFKAPMIKTVLLFAITDIVFISLASWFFLGLTQPAIEEGILPENLL